ncbi:hypothetical protein SCHPADRAFT_674780 [Schizopora paradoxa]|uniref:Uncharacterized protein n=1 Tax=Schizopora paradoxa TaxID=27342 RepID=A0A0H2RBJ4_9AGAM|nr:hypothetical protein SCHPADRAFT_674780 [Schizopora paradoxa]
MDYAQLDEKPAVAGTIATSKGPHASNITVKVDRHSSDDMSGVVKAAYDLSLALEEDLMVALDGLTGASAFRNAIAGVVQALQYWRGGVVELFDAQIPEGDPIMNNPDAFYYSRFDKKLRRNPRGLVVRFAFGYEGSEKERLWKDFHYNCMSLRSCLALLHYEADEYLDHQKGHFTKPIVVLFFTVEEMAVGLREELLDDDEWTAKSLSDKDV